MSSDCYFKFNRLAFGESIPRDASTDLSAVECEGECVLVADSYSGLKRNICLHGFSSVSKLLFFRANAELPTEDEMEKIANQVSELLSEKQVQGLFSRMEKKRTSGVRGVVKGAKAKKGQSATTVPSEKNRKRKHSEKEDANAKKVQPVAAAKDDADEEESEEEETNSTSSWKQ